ncbi:Gfo/Idh/MocA family protein [Rhizobium sp. SGZ-381]|uniref:Gfo/Idh/MocA family protein n=1 Tax=Rhizobium sp. SGZ-381 TaxID=3342800 RepID=UPI00367240EB
MTRRICVAIAGAGIGKAHILGYAQLPHLFDVRYVCDLNPERAAAGAAEAPGSRPISDLDAVLADPQVELVDLCLPPRLHAPMTLKALAAGKHVVCEKPLAGSLADVSEIRDAAAQFDRQVFPIFQYRYGAGYHAAHALKRKGLLGRPFVLSLETHWDRRADYYAERWRGTWEGELGGALVSHAIHAHNLVAHLAGEITEVAAFIDTRVNPIETEDCAALSMRTREGALVSSSISLGACGSTSRFRALFEHMTITSGTEPYHIGSGPWTFEARDPARQAEVDAIVAEHDQGIFRFAGQFADVHARLTGGAEFYLPSLDEAYQSIELITALYDAARNRRIVSLPLPSDHPLRKGWLPA